MVDPKGSKIVESVGLRHVNSIITRGLSASHGACKPCSELGLSQEPRITDAESGGYAEVAGRLFSSTQAKHLSADSIS